MRKRIFAFVLAFTLILSNVMMVSAEESSESKIESFSFGTDADGTSVTFWANATLSEGEKLIAGYMTAEDKEAGSTEMATAELEYVGGDGYAYEVTVYDLAEGTYYVENLQLVSSTDELIDICTTVDGYEVPCFTIGQEEVLPEECKHENTTVYETDHDYQIEGPSSYVEVTQCSDCWIELSREKVEFYEYGVEFIGYGTDITFKINEGEDSSGNLVYSSVTGKGFYTTLRGNGGLVGEQLSGMFVMDSNPTKAGAKFEGWAKFVWENDEDGYSYAKFQKKSKAAPYFTLDEVMAEQVTANVVYAAKWSDVEIDNYFKESGVTISPYAEEIIKFQQKVWDEDAQKEVWVDCEGSFSNPLYYGTSLKSEYSNEIRMPEDPVRAGAKFEGWAKFEVDEETWDHTFVPFSTSKMYFTTEEMFKDVSLGVNVEFVPKWSDISIDEYFPINYTLLLDANGGEITEVYTWSEDVQHTYYSKIAALSLMENKSLKETMAIYDEEVTSVGKEGKVLESWKVYQAEEMEPAFVEKGAAAPKGASNQLVVYYDTYEYDELGVQDVYFVLTNYKLVDKSMSTEKLFTACKNTNYYAIANWKDSVAVVEDAKVNEALENEQKAIVEAIVNGTVDENVVSKETAANVKMALEEGKKITTSLVVCPLDESFVSASVKADMLNNAVKELNGDVKIQYLDIQVLLKADDAVLGNINELQKEIEITVAIPDNMKVENAKYVVIRNHNGEIDVLPVTVNDDGTITFKTDKFSTYALAYAEEKGTSESAPDVNPESNEKAPETGDNNMIIGYAFTCVLALAIVVFLKKKEIEARQ